MQSVLNKLEEIEALLLYLLGPEGAEYYMSVIEDQDLFIEKTAHELLWGYTDPLFKLLMGIGLTSESLMRIEVS